MPRRSPGVVRDAIIGHLKTVKKDATLDELQVAVNAALGSEVPPSSIRSYLNQNTPGVFVRTGHGRYRLAKR